MHRNVALLTRLGQIAALPCPCDERIACALTLVKADIARLFAGLGIRGPERIDSKAKTIADDMLAELRNQVLATEVHTPASSRPIFTAVRHRLEMTRRVLASRIAEERPAIPFSTVAEQITKPHWIIRAWPHFPAVPSVQFRVVQLTRQGIQRARRARFGSLSGQLTM